MLNIYINGHRKIQVAPLVGLHFYHRVHKTYAQFNWIEKNILSTSSVYACEKIMR